MDKLEKVMKGLGCCSQGAKEPYTPTIRYCAECPYLKSEIPCTRALARDALKLLKAQEPMAPVYDQLLTQEIPRCGKCGYRLVKGNDKYCCRCGQAVKWDG